MVKIEVCLVVRKMHQLKKTQWLIEVYGPAFQCQCGDTLCPKNDPSLVKCLQEEWSDDRTLVEVRHKLHCSSTIEVQVSL